MMMMMNNEPDGDGSGGGGGVLDLNNSAKHPGFIQHPLVFQHHQQQQHNVLYSSTTVNNNNNNLGVDVSSSPSLCVTCTSTTLPNVVSGPKPPKVSFLEYVEVSGTGNSGSTRPHNHHNHDPVSSSTSQQQQQQQNEIHHTQSPTFHYEPLRPAASPTISSSNNSSPLSPLVSLEQIRSVSPYGPLITPLLPPHAPSSTSSSPHLENFSHTTTNVIYKPVRSLIQYWPEQQPTPPQHNHPHHLPQFDHSDSINLLSTATTSTDCQSLANNGTLIGAHHPMQALPVQQGDALISKSSSSDSDTNDSGTRLISDSINDDIVSASIHPPPPPPSSHHHHHLHQNNAHHLHHHHVYLSNSLANNGGSIINQCFTTSPTIDTIVEQEQEILPPQNQLDTLKNDQQQPNCTDDLWIQVQGDMSKNLREKFLQNQSNLGTNSNCGTVAGNNVTTKSASSNRTKKKDSFRFRRIGCGECGFVCPLSHRTKKCLVSSSSAIVALCAIICAIFLLIWFFHYNGGWFGLWRMFGRQTNNQPRRYQFEQDPFWYHGTTIYEIFPASFKDTDGDGFGDLNGIIERAQYLRSLGISAIRLNSIFAAFDYPKYYDNVLNFYDVDPHLGNFASFFKMIKVLHSNQIRVILDLNPTVTSDEHPWSLNQSEEYQYFYAPTTKAQTMVADIQLYGYGSRRLNWSHEAVRTQILKVADFWLNHVDGLYLKNLEHIYVHGDDVDDHIGGSVDNFDHHQYPNTNSKTMSSESFNKSDGDDRSKSVGSAMNREKILLEFLQRLRRISDYHEQMYAKNHKLSIVKVPKKILICSSQLIQPLLTTTMNIRRRGLKAANINNNINKNLIKKHKKKKKKRRQTYFSNIPSNGHPNQQQQPHQSEYRPEFDELDLEEFDIISADSQKMLPSVTSSSSSSSSSLSNNISASYDSRQPDSSKNNHSKNKNNNKSSLNRSTTTKTTTTTATTRSIYHYFDLVHFDLRLRPNHIDNMRDQVNYVFLNRPLDFPAIVWSIGNSQRSRLANQLGGAKYSLASLFLLAMMPGTISFFYGDEIGLQNVYDFHSKKVYPGGHLCPMAWTSDPSNGNFSLPNQTHTWIPMHPDYMQINVEKRHQMVKIVSDLINFRLDYLYSDFEPPPTADQGSSIETSINNAQQSAKKPKNLVQQRLNYLFHYIDQNVVVFEQYFDRINPSSSLSSSTENVPGDNNEFQSLLSRFRYVVFANLGNETVVKDFSDKFHFSLIQLATNINRTSEFLIMKSLKLDPGEAMIATVE